MTHIRRAYPQGVFAPPVDLGGSGGPQDVVEKDIPNSRKSWKSVDLNIAITYDAALNVGDSIGGLRKAWGNWRVLWSVRTPYRYINYKNILRPGHGEGPEVWDV